MMAHNLLYFILLIALYNSTKNNYYNYQYSEKPALLMHTDSTPKITNNLILARYNKPDGKKLGKPLTNLTTLYDTILLQQFEKGAIITNATSAYILPLPISKNYDFAIAGYATTEAKTKYSQDFISHSVTTQHFEKGTYLYSTATKAFFITPSFYTYWQLHCKKFSIHHIGLPISNASIKNDITIQQFQRGKLVLQNNTINYVANVK
jgi:hypothetical protein